MADAAAPRPSTLSSGAARRAGIALAAAAVVAAAGTVTTVAVRSGSSDAPRTAVVPAAHAGQAPAARADAAESAHGSGPARTDTARSRSGGPATLPAGTGQSDPVAEQFVHGTRGSLSDAAGQPLAR